MKLIESFYHQSLSRIESDILTSVMAYVSLSHEANAFEVLFDSIKSKINSDVAVQPTNEVSKLQTSKKD